MGGWVGDWLAARKSSVRQSGHAASKVHFPPESSDPTAEKAAAQEAEERPCDDACKKKKLKKKGSCHLKMSHREFASVNVFVSESPP